MVKHIIMLALCFMVYIVINIDTVTAPWAPSSYDMVTTPFNPMAMSALCLKFTWLIECYKIMVERKLIKIRPNWQGTTINTTFQEAVNLFYSSYEIPIVNEPNVGDIPTITSEMFSSNQAYNYKRNAFDHYFDQIQITDDIRSALDADPLIIERTHIPFTFYHTKETPEYFCLRYSFHIIF